MTEEEYQAKILEHENTITTLNTKLSELETKESTYKTDMEKLNADITKLKDHNMQLFLKITDPNTKDHDKKDPENQKSKTKDINDIIKEMTNKE